ncbi:hypothetical protein D3C84_1022990 [compost metagenome]
MWKLVPRFDLWSRFAWCSYLLLGCILYLTSNLDSDVIVCAQLFLSVMLCAPGFCKPLRRWLERPRTEELRLLGRLFVA